MDPTQLRRPRIDLSLFDGLPVYTSPGLWTAEDILLHLPTGALGIEGHSADWIQSLHRDSLQRLATLLNCADNGQLPAFWRHARVTLIPKGEDSPPDERRPITIMSITYRLWARRHAAHLNEWMATWKPAGLSGAMKNTCCPDVLWELQVAFTKAYTGDSPAAFVLSMDLEKCFDTMDIDNLERIAAHLGLVSCSHALRNYRRRFLAFFSSVSSLRMSGWKEPALSVFLKAARLHVSCATWLRLHGINIVNMRYRLRCSLRPWMTGLSLRTPGLSSRKFCKLRKSLTRP